MHLMMDGQMREFVEIRAFRASQGLPEEFRVAYFEPKDYTGLGSIEHAAHDLVDLRRRLLAAMPSLPTLPQWMAYLPGLQQLFRDQLEAINEQVGLREVEIDFAAAGFGDVCQAWVYALVHAQASRQPPPPFKQVYAEWLYSTIRQSALVHRYQDWQVQMITHAYGRIGLAASRGDQTFYVYDAALACPAEGYMLTLLSDVTAQIAKAVNLHKMD